MEKKQILLKFFKDMGFEEELADKALKMIESALSEHTSKAVNKNPLFGHAFETSKANYSIDHSGLTNKIYTKNQFLKDFVNNGNAFISKEAAEYESRKRRIKQKIRKLMADDWGDERPDLSDTSQSKFYVRIVPRYKDKAKILDINDTLVCGIFFRTATAAQQCIEDFSLEELKMAMEL